MLFVPYSFALFSVFIVVGKVEWHKRVYVIVVVDSNAIKKRESETKDHRLIAGFKNGERTGTPEPKLII